MIATRVFEAAGVAILHSAWQSTAIALSTYLLLRSIPPQNTRRRYSVGLMALIAMVALPVLSALQPMRVQRLVPGPAVLTRPPVAPPAAEPSSPASDSAEELTPIATVDAQATSASPFTAPLAMLVFPLGVLWVVGLSFRIGSLAMATYRVRRTIAAADSVVCWRTLRVLRQACRAYGVAPTRVRLLSVHSDSGPALVGMIRPSIVIPNALLTTLPDDALRALFIHELAHLKRHDLLVNPLLQLVDAVFFYHPVARRLVATVERERERCCDDAVISTGVPPDQYVATLLEVARLTPRPPRLAMSAMSGGELLRRAERLLTPRASASSLWRVVRDRAGALISCWAALAFVVPVSIASAPIHGSEHDLALQLRAVADSAGRERWIAFAVPLTTVPLSDAERPHSGWGTMIEMGAASVPYRMASIVNERLIIAVRMNPRSAGNAARVTAVAFRTAGDAAMVLPPSVTSIGEFTNIESARAIGELINDARASARRELFAVLALHDDPVSGQLLAAAVTGDPAPTVRAESVRWLRYRPARESVPLLRGALNDADPDVRDEAITTLRQITDLLGRELLEETDRMNDSASVRRKEAASLPR